MYSASIFKIKVFCKNLKNLNKTGFASKVPPMKRLIS
jgi:hypothetical protein